MWTVGFVLCIHGLYFSDFSFYSVRSVPARLFPVQKYHLGEVIAMCGYQPPSTMGMFEVTGSNWNDAPHWGRLDYIHYTAFCIKFHVQSVKFQIHGHCKA